MALMVNVTDGLEIVAGRNYVLSIDRNITAAEGEHCLQILRDRFPGSQFVLVPPHTFVREDLPAQGGPVTKGQAFEKEAGEVFIPYGENGPEPMVPRVVRQNDLVDAIKRAEAECERQWKLSRAGDRQVWSGAALALHELVAAFLNPPVNVSTEDKP